MEIQNCYRELIRAAMDNIKHSYAPYSGFNVSAAVLAESGKIYTGVNVENASYPAGMCAERNAIGQAVNAGEKKMMAIAIVGGKGMKISDYCSPCGICRQVMREFGDPDSFRIILAVSENEYREYLLGELLPESFGPESLAQ